MDCRQGLTLLKDESVDCVITDPPYEVGYPEKMKRLRQMDHGTEKHHQNGDYVEIKNNSMDWHWFANQLYRVLKHNTHCYIFFAEKQSMTIIKAMQDAGFKFIQYLIWNKNRPTVDMTFGYKYLYKHELCGFFQKGWKKLNRNRGQYTIINHSIMGEQQDYKHPTQKPLPIIVKFLLNSSKENDLILDPFMGSGTTAVASKMHNRNFIGFELSQKYVDVSNERLNQNNLTTWTSIS